MDGTQRCDLCEDVADLRFELRVKSSAEEAELELFLSQVVLCMLMICVLLGTFEKNESRVFHCLHTSAYVSIRQHTSAFVNIYVSIRFVL
jgi:hypothetical protein